MSPSVSFTFSPAQTLDATAIASLLASYWNTPFTALQFGTLDPQSLAAEMTPRIAQQIASETSPTAFEVARSLQDDGDVVAVAQWTSHSAMIEEEDADDAERRQFEQEVYFNSLPDSCNKSLIMEFETKQRDLRDVVMRGHSRYLLLDNLATKLQHRRKGLAARLVSRGMERAEDMGVGIYLDTGSENDAALGLYKKLGFEERGRRCVENLGRFGGAEGEAYEVVGLVKMARREEER